MDTVRQCQRCGNPIPSHRAKSATFCSNRCRQIDYQTRLGNRTQASIPSRTRSCINELIVSSDLLERGYAVYRAMSVSCLIDLVAIKDDAVFRVEVKTGQYNAAGELGRTHVPKRQREHCEVVAFVMNDNRIFYEPEFPGD